MSRKEINIGIEGNDGTGDSIRDSFSKVNENFTELYSSLGLGDALSFVGLADTPGIINESDNNKVLAVDGNRETIVFKEIIGSNTIVIDSVEINGEAKIRINSLASSLINDNEPTLARYLDANGKKIQNLEDPTSDQDASTKIYTDTKLSIAGTSAIDPDSQILRPEWGIMTGSLILSRNPTDADDVGPYAGKIAATKAYVDSKSYSSSYTLFVATNGSDTRTDIPVSDRGRSPAAAYQTIQKACEVAEEIVNSAPLELGPYQKVLTYNNGTENCTVYDIVESPISGRGAKAEAKLGLDSYTIVNAGAQYEQEQILSLVGGTGTIVASLRVVATTFSGGITALEIIDSGSYSSLPDPVSNMQLLGGANSGASISGTFKIVSIEVTDQGGDKPSVMSAATKTNPVVITTTAEHGYDSGDLVSISDVVGMTQLNGTEYYIDVISPTEFELYEDSALTNTVNGTGFNNYISGGDILEGRDYGSASVLFEGGGGSGAEAITTEVGGLIREINVVKSGTGYTSFPTLTIFLPRMLVETNNKGTDFFDDLREGQLLKGVTSGAFARIVGHSGERIGGREIFDIELLSGTFEANEVLQYGEPSQSVQVTIWIATGVYYENYPLLAAANVTLRGEDFRRIVVRPKPGVSESPWVRRFFRRDTVIDGLRVTPVEYGYHYLTDPLDYSSTPKNNDEIDVVLCNDATRIAEMTFQGHGGFNMVLDPNGQILSKSPYFQTGTTISRSINAKIFAGGQFVDGFSGNQQGILLEDIDGDPSKVLIGGLNRAPQLPTSFVIDGEIFRISLTNKLETEYFSAKLLLEANRRFIQEEVLQYVNIQSPDLEYDPVKCFRDVGLIVDAVVQDVLYGGFANSAQAGRLYFKNGLTVVDGQVTQTRDAVLEAKRLAIAAINQDVQAPTNTNGVSQVTFVNITDGGLAETVVGDCFDIIANIIEYGESIYAAKELLAANKEFIQQEVIQYINQTYVFDYNETTCRRDIGLILDALRYDLMFGSNFLSIQSGMAYYRANASVTVTGIEKTAIIAALEELKDILSGLLISSVTARSRTIANMETIIDIVTNGLSVVPTPTIPDPTSYDTGYSNARRLIVANKEFIKSEITAWIAVQVAAANSPFAAEFAYDAVTCARDIGYIVDALQYDLTYGGNLATRIAASAYYAGSTYQGGPVELDETLAAYSYLKSIIDNIASKSSIPVSAGNGLTQDISGTAGSGGAATFAQARIQDIYDMINTGTLPAEITPSTSWVTGTLVTASDLINTNKEDIKDDVILLINTDYLANTLSYNQATCKRDVGFVVDALSIDIFGDYNNTVRAGYSYYSKGQRYIPSNQLEATLDSFDYVKTLALNIVKSETPDVIRTTKTFSPYVAIDTATNIFTIANHGFTTGSRVVYSNGGGTDIPSEGNLIVDGETYYTYVFDGATFKLYESLELLISAERTGTEGLEIDISNEEGALDYIGNRHSFNFQQQKNVELSETTLTDAGVITSVETGMGYINAILAGGDSTAVPSIYPQYECVLDTPYNYMYPAKVVLSTAGNKSMLGNDFTQVNDMGYGIFAMNNGLIESVSVFTYYCHTAYYALNGAQIRCLNGSSAHGVYALKSEGADPVEIPDRVTLKFPTIQTADIYENLALDLTNAEESLEIFITNYQFLPLNGCAVDIDHTGDPGASSRLGVETYNVTAVSTENLPAGVAQLGLAATGTPVGLKNAVPAGKNIIIRLNDEVVLAGKETIVATRPSTALIWDENRGNVTRVLSFATYNGEGFEEADVTTTSRDGFDYVSLTVPRASGASIQPADHGDVGDTQIAVDALNFTDAERLLYPTTGSIIYDGSTIGTGGMIFGWGDSVYEITNYEVINAGDPENEYGRVTFVNRTKTLLENPSGGLTKSIIGIPGNFDLYAGLRSGATGDVTVNISTMRATGHDMLDIGTGSYADTNYPNNIFGPPNNPVNAENQAKEEGKGRVFFVSTDQSGNFRVGALFGIDQGTGVVDLGAKISLTNVQALRLKAGAQIVEFSTDVTLGGTGPAANDQVPTENAIRSYIDKRLGLRHTGGLLGTGLIGPGFLPLDGTLPMKAPLDVDDNPIRNLPAVPTRDGDAVPKSWIKLANLQDSPNDWLDSTPAYNTVDAQLLTFTGTDANFINATVGGAITFTRSGRTLTATINDGIIVNADVNDTAAIAQSKLSMTLASSRAAAPTGLASVKQAASGLSSYDETQFTVTDGYVTVKTATSTANGVPITKLTHIDPTVVDATDNATIATTGKVLGRRRGSSTGAIVPVDFKTVIEDGDGLSRAEIPSLGVVVRNAVGTGTGKFTTINYSAENNNEYFIRRDGTDGGFAAGTISAVAIGLTGDVTAASLKLTKSTSTQKVVERFADVALSNDFYTMLYDGNGGIGIRINSGSGSGSSAKQYTDYYAAIHNFKTDDGSGAGTVNVGSGGTLTTGATANGGNIVGQWSLGAGSRMQATWADLAEYYTADHDYQPGTVVVFGGEAEVTTSNIAGDTRVAGVVSTNPAYLLNNECPGMRVAVALQGRVPCQIVGKVSKGDLIVTSKIPGVAVAVKGKATPGTIIGKALESYDSDEIGIIEVAVGRL